MAVEENNQQAEENQEKTVLPEQDGEGGEAAGTQARKKGGFGKYVFLLLAAVAAGAAGVPQSREFLSEKYREILAAVEAKTENVTGKPAEEPAPSAEIAVRLEQLENERDFEKAETIVASIEEPEIVEVSTASEQLLKAEVKGLRVQIERLKAELAQIRASLPKNGLLEERLLSVNAREDAFERQLVEIGAKTDLLEKNKADASAVLSVMTRLEITEQKLLASGMEKERSAALLLAVYQLREAAATGRSFLVEQQSALALADSMPRIAGFIRSLSVAADQGVWTKTALKQSFSSYADKAVLAETADVKKDWFHQAINSLRALVVIRRIDVSDADDVSAQAVLARAQQAVDNEDFAIAVLQLSLLQGKAADAVKDWVQAAQRYVTTQKTISETVAAVLGVVYADNKGE